MSDNTVWNRSNSGKTYVSDSQVEVFVHKKFVEFPKDKRGAINAVIHKKLQDNDYKALKPGDPIFMTFNNEVITFKEEETLYPIFINEAAYYYQNIAFSLTKKIVVDCNKGLKSI